MKILWFTWKDHLHPFSGGAESVDKHLAQKLASDGHELIMITGGYENCEKEEIINGYKIIRVGNLFTVYYEAFRYYKKHLSNWPDLIIEEINTIPFMTQWYAKQKRVLLIYQLCRKIWFYQLPLPFSLIGYLLEPIYLFFLRKNKALTESQSTKDDLQIYGFKEKNINVFPICIDIKPLSSINNKQTFQYFTILSLGAIRNMKRTLDQIKAFEFAKKEIPELKMKVAGLPIGSYGKKVLEYITNSPFKKDIEYIGKVSIQEKIDLMKKSHLILVTSVKEGWGLIVTEAGSQGTPAIVYNVDGLRDSVDDRETGVILNSKNKPEELAKKIIELHKDKKMYLKLSEKTLENSKKYTLTTMFEEFKKNILSL
jgi:glycosyltransferase involved in cell wall biosynthesis